MERRSFIQGVGIAGLALLVGDSFGSPLSKRNLSLQLYSVRDAVAKDLEKTLARLREIGYDKLEIYGYNGTFFGKTVKEFKKILADNDMKVISSHHVTGFTNKQKGTLLDDWKQSVDDIAAIGGKYMACAYIFPEERTEKNYDVLPDLLNKSGEVSKASGIQFAYHNHDFEFEKYRDTIVYDHLLNNTHPDLVKMEMDLYWTIKAGKDPVAYFEKHPGRFALWHVKDMEAGTGDITEVGHGTIDFKRIFAARKIAGLQHWFVEQDVSKGDMFESIKFSRDYLIKNRFR